MKRREEKNDSPVDGILAIVFAVLIVGFFSSVSFGQTDITETAPPPLKILTPDERSRLEAQTDIKRRTKLALELMNARIIHAEEHSRRQEFEQLFEELGRFHALMDHTLEFLNKSDKDSGKVLSNFKRLEIGLREFRPRLEVVRRDLPIKYEYYVRVLIRYLREARSKAIEPLFDDSVVPVRKPGNDQ